MKKKRRFIIFLEINVGNAVFLKWFLSPRSPRFRVRFFRLGGGGHLRAWFRDLYSAHINLARGGGGDERRAVFGEAGDGGSCFFCNRI